MKTDAEVHGSGFSGQITACCQSINILVSMPLRLTRVVLSWYRQLLVLILGWNNCRRRRKSVVTASEPSRAVCRGSNRNGLQLEGHREIFLAARVLFLLCRSRFWYDKSWLSTYIQLGIGGQSVLVCHSPSYQFVKLEHLNTENRETVHVRCPSR